MPQQTLLITGSAGKVGRMLRPLLSHEFRLRCLDERPDEVLGEEERIVGDATDVALMEQACAGVDTVVHLAGFPVDADFLTELVPRNIIATWATLEAARRAGVHHVVLASTIQTVIGAAPADAYRVGDVPEPLNLYGCSKLFGEAAGRYYARQHGLRVTCVRLGACLPPEHPWLEGNAELADCWCDPSDLARLITASVRSDVTSATVFAVSRPADRVFDTTNPFGWVPTSTPAVRTEAMPGSG